jgi:hypothetical protein
MARFCANRPNRTLILHKEVCKTIPYDDLEACGCGLTGNEDNQYWYCEEHITIDEVRQFMGDRFWAVLPCGRCFNERPQEEEEEIDMVGFD